ncbi:MAG TPA: DMT family transporter [Paracoccaceae bacterium]|nr:DMT family transporter [Paracoccaceae bacterium]
MLLLLIVLGTLWGLHIVFAKAIGAEGVREAVAMLALYVWSSAIVLIGVAWLRGRAFRPDLPVIRYFIISSALGYLGPIFFELFVAPNIDASLFALIVGASPLATVCIAAATGRDRLSGTLIAALAAGSAAALMLLGPAALGGSAPIFWVAIAFAVPFLYGAGDVYIEAKWPRELDVLQVAAGECATASLWVALFALGAGVGPPQMIDIALDAGWPAAGLIATSLTATWLYFSLLGRVGAIFVSFGSYVTIATGVTAGVLIFGERLGPALLLAGALTAFALWLLNRDRVRAAETAGGAAE